MALTPEGESLLRVLTESFDRIDGALSAIASRKAPASVTISVEPSFAALWMVPNLAAFRSLHPDIEVKVESEPRLVEFRGSEAVLAIRHSGTRSAWPRTEARLLMRTSMVPVLAPPLLENGTVLRTPEDIRQFDLLHEENRSYWSDWFRMAGAPEENHDRGPVFADGSLVLQAALRGHGAALSDPAFIEEDLRDGRLVAPFDIRMPCGAYYLVARSFKTLPKPAAALAAWILSRFPSG